MELFEKILLNIFKASNGNTNKPVSSTNISNNLSLTSETLSNTLDYLENQFLIQQIGFSGSDVAIVITFEGIEEAKNILEERENETQMPQAQNIEIFISHSARDENLASALIELLRSALNISADKIRCTTVPGYKLPIGANTGNQLRGETLSARVLVGLITEISIESAYVLFELGARWGSGGFLAPLLAAGATPKILKGPLSGINALSCDEKDLMQFVQNIGKELNLNPENPEVYFDKIKNVIGVSNGLAEERQNNVINSDNSTSSNDIFELDDFQKDYLLKISNPVNNGEVLDFFDHFTGREAVKMKECIELFHLLGLLYYNGQIYRLTSKGWKVTDQLWELKILDQLDFKNHIHESQIIKDIGLPEDNTGLEEIRRHSDSLEKNQCIQVIRTRGGNSLGILEEGLTRRKHFEIDLS